MCSLFILNLYVIICVVLYCMLKKKSERINVVVFVDVVIRWSINDLYEICKLICYKKNYVI